MKSTAPLTGSHLRTYNAIFQHPVSHNLAWHDVNALFRHVAEVTEEPNGNLKVTRNGETLVLHPPRTKEVGEIAEIITLRHFLERSDKVPAEAQAPGTDWLVVIDHHEARIYRSLAAGTIPQLIRPHTADETSRHLPDAKGFARGKEMPEPNQFFEPVAALLHGAGRVLLFGHGTGHSSEMDQFVAWLKKHRPAVAKRLSGSVVVDEHHLTEAQLLARARDFYAHAPAA